MSLKQVFKKTALCFAVAGMMNSYSALAGPALLSSAQLNFNGKVVASACTITSDSKTVNVPLGGAGQTIEASTLAPVGGATDWEKFSLKMSNCPTTTTAVKATFTGNQADESAALYRNDGEAESVQIELTTDPGVDGTAVPLGNNASHEELVNAGDHTATFNLRARAISTHGDATPGDIKGAVQIAFTYR